MGFAVIGYPTKRHSNRSIHDQLPYELRSENDNKNDMYKQKLSRGRRKKNIKKFKKQKLISGKLKELNRLDTNNDNDNDTLLTDDDKFDQQLIESTWPRRNLNTQYDMVQTRSNWLSQINTVMRSTGSNVTVLNQRKIRSYYTGRDIKFRRWQPTKSNVQDSLMSDTLYTKDNSPLLRPGGRTKHSDRKTFNSMESEVCKESKEHTKKERKPNEVVYDNISTYDDNSNQCNVNIQGDLKKSADLEIPGKEIMIKQSNMTKQKQNVVGNNKITDKLSFDKLPPEVIQKIFIFSFANYNMLLINKYLNNCLRLSDHLLEINFIENYIHIIDYNNTREDSDNMLLRVKCLNTKIFDDPIMTQFFLKRLKYLRKKFDKFITDDIIYKGLANYKKPSLSHRLYVNTIDYYFKNVRILKYFFKHFEVVVSSLIDNIIEWFFQFQIQYKIQHFLHVMKIIRKYCKKYDYLKDKTNFTAHHLVSILEYLFLNKSDRQLITINFLQGLTSFIEEEDEIEENIDNIPLEKLKIKFVDVYLSMFYKPLFVDNENNVSDINMVLNDSSLWSCLREISNIELIDVFVSHGVRPSYGHII